MQKIIFHSDIIDLRKIHEALKAAVEGTDGYVVEWDDRKTRSIETPVLVALVGAAGTGLGALITALLKTVGDLGGRKIIVQGVRGARVEVPVGLQGVELDEVVELIRKLEADHIAVR